MNYWKELLSLPAADNHLVQFYGDERSLLEKVGHYLREGAAQGGWMIVIATPAHVEAFSRILREAGADPDGLARDGRLTVRDAETTLSQFMVDREPDWERFESSVGGLVQGIRLRCGDASLRAYGEMVDLLWKSGRLEAAARVEEFWNRLLKRHRFGLFCAYTLDILAEEVSTECIREMLKTHTHLLPVRGNGELDQAVNRALEEILGAERTARLLPLVRASERPRPSLPAAEATVLWLRNNLPAYAHEVLERARVHYESLCDEKGERGPR